MLKLKSITDQLDFGGMIASGLCAIHCLAIPILFSVGASSNWAWLENRWLELGFFAFALFFAIASLFRSYSKHQSWGPLALAGIGVALLGVHIFQAHHSHHFHFHSILGGVFLVGAHFWNFRLSRKQNACPNPSLRSSEVAVD